MVANSVVSASDSYMTSDSRRSGIVRLVTDKGTAEEEKKNQSCDSTPLKFPCRDSATNYMWSSRSSNEMNWQSAINYCQNLTEGGHSDWRLPNISEIITITKYGKSVDSDGVWFWSSATRFDNRASAWRVDFESWSERITIKAENYYVRCVRKAD